MLLQERHLPFHLIRHERIIGGEPAPVRAARFLKSEVGRGRDAAMRVPIVGEHLHPPREARRVAPGDLQALVRRAVVDDDDLNVGIGLGQDALDGRGEERRMIE